jgi:hypothetical protein
MVDVFYFDEVDFSWRKTERETCLPGRCGAYVGLV